MTVFTSSSFREIAVCVMTILSFHRQVTFLLLLKKKKKVAHTVNTGTKGKNADQ